MTERAPAAKPNRPRNPDAPPKNTRRPRDELGRPLPWGTPTRLQMADFDANTIEENHRLGIGYLNSQRFFPAHEAWEACWKQAKGTHDEEFFKGLSQLGAGYVHYQRENLHGVFTLLRRGATRIERYGPGEHLGVDAGTLAATALTQADEVERAHRAGLPMPTLAYPRI